jgi:hypothetical protein
MAVLWAVRLASLVPDEGIVPLQLSHPVVGSLCGWRILTGIQDQCIQNIRCGSVICDQRNDREQSLNLFTNPFRIVLLLAQNRIRIFHGCSPEPSLPAYNEHLASEPVKKMNALRVDLAGTAALEG